MKDRLLTNWTLTRAIYLVIGVLVIIQTSIDEQWIGVLFGSYFAIMGLFSIGCASGSCESPTNKTK